MVSHSLSLTEALGFTFHLTNTLVCAISMPSLCKRHYLFWRLSTIYLTKVKEFCCLFQNYCGGYCWLSTWQIQNHLGDGFAGMPMGDYLDYTDKGRETHSAIPWLGFWAVELEKGARTQYTSLSLCHGSDMTRWVKLLLPWVPCYDEQNSWTMSKTNPFSFKLAHWRILLQQPKTTEDNYQEKCSKKTSPILTLTVWGESGEDFLLGNF